jgi:hypothetical protein
MLEISATTYVLGKNCFVDFLEWLGKLNRAFERDRAI